MSLGSWDPNIVSIDATRLLDAEVLHRLIDYARDDQLQRLDSVLGDEDRQRLAGLMKIDHQDWLAAAESMPEEDLIHLIRFFAVAENLPGWEAGATSPVIPLAKVLRQRGRRLDTGMLQWLREVSDNRYLPYGPL